MSVRFGVLLALEPSFTARVYRARQLICGQYGSWAAEMHMLHLTVAGFFQCSESQLSAVDAGLAGLTAQARREASHFSLGHRGVATFPDVSGTIFLDFDGPERPEILHTLHASVIELLKTTPEVVPGLRFALDDYWPHVTLMQYANLPPAVFDDAVEFARVAVDDLQVPANTNAWRLLLTRFQSQAAGDDWSGGSWAADLTWRVVSSYPL